MELKSKRSSPISVPIRTLIGRTSLHVFVLVLSGTLFLATLWEFVLEGAVWTALGADHAPEPLDLKIEFIITSAAFVAVSLIIPCLLLHRNGDVVWDGNFFDITEQRLAKTALQESEAQIRLITG